MKGPGRREEHKRVGQLQGLRSAKIACMRHFGMKRSQMPTVLGTSKMIEKWLTKYRDDINEFEEFLNEVAPKTLDEIIDTTGITDERSFLEAFNTQFGPMFAVLVRALKNSDGKVAMSACTEILKLKGFNQSKLTVTHKGKVAHEHEEQRHVLDVTPAMAKLVNGLHARKQLPPAFRGDVKEAETVSRS